MRVPRLYCPRLHEGFNTLDVEEAHHATRVLRLGIGDEVELFDGAGGETIGHIQSASRNAATVVAEAITRQPFDLRVRLTLAVAMTRAHRQNYLIEKCTELGAAAFWPILTDFSVTEPAEAAIERWSRRAIEACKQSRRPWAPTVEPVQALQQAITRAGGFAVALAAVPHAPRPLDQAIEVLCAGAGLLVFIGPEGGWSPSELAAFDADHVNTVALSPTTLRTETAAVAVCAAVALSSCSRPFAR